MAHRIEMEADLVKSVGYSWRFRGRENKLKLTVRNAAKPLREGSEAEFITEHHWGYNRQRSGATLEYRVEHPSWRVYDVADAKLDCDVAGLYGEPFYDCLNCKPASAFLAEGSHVTVFRGVELS